MRLRRQLVALIALVLLLSLAAGAVLTYWHAVRKIEIEMAAALRVGEASVADAIGALAETDDVQAQIRRSISSFDGERHLRVGLVTPSGSMVQQSQIALPADPAPEWLRRLLTNTPHASGIALPEKFRLPGTMHIEADPLNEVTEVWEDVKLKLAIIAGFFTLVLGLVYWTLGRALRPLENLRTAIAEIGHGNFAAHVSETGPEDLKTIYQQFNRMADELAQAERQNRSLNEQLSTVQEEERADIARDLHDEIGPFLFAVDVDAQTIPAYLDRGATTDAVGRAAAIRQSVAHMQTHLRSILSRLRPAMLLDLGLSHAIEQLAGFWRRRRPEIDIDVAVAQTSFGARIDEVAYRVVQEAVSNAIRHGKPQRIAVRVRAADGRLQIEVSDDGKGLQKNGSQGLGSPGFGLTGMRERLSALGGALRVENNAGGSGVSLIAELPLGEPVQSKKLTVNVGVRVQ